MRWLFALLILTSVAFAQSQGPSPPVGEKGQAKSTTTQQDPAAEPKNASQPPIIVNVLPAPKSESEQANETRERHEKANTDRRLVEFTADLASYTARLYYATLAVAIATICLVLATVGLVIFGVIQTGQMKIAAKAAQTSAESLPIIEGAYVYPSIIKVDIADSLGAFQNSEISTNRLLIEYEFKNFGKTPAIIQRLGAGLIHHNPRASGAVGLALAPVDKSIIAANDGTGKMAAEITGFSRANWETVAAEKTQIIFYGSVVYSDIFGESWSFSFNWQYSYSLGRFLPDNKPRQKAKT